MINIRYLKDRFQEKSPYDVKANSHIRSIWTLYGLFSMKYEKVIVIVQQYDFDSLFLLTYNGKHKLHSGTKVSHLGTDFCKNLHKVWDLPPPLCYIINQ